MRTARFPSSGGESAQPSWMQIPPETESHLRQTPLDAGHVTCDVCWEAKPTPVNRMTHRCKNITFPQLRLRVVNIDVLDFDSKQIIGLTGTLFHLLKE